MVKKNYTVCLDMDVVNQAKKRTKNFSEFINGLIESDNKKSR